MPSDSDIGSGSDVVGGSGGGGGGGSDGWAGTGTVGFNFPNFPRSIIPNDSCTTEIKKKYV